MSWSQAEQENRLEGKYASVFGGATDAVGPERPSSVGWRKTSTCVSGRQAALLLMQYYGYLRRNPDDPQDTDFRGWEFWLNKLNQFNGNFVAAEMVKAFIVSIEYRQRFGQ